MQRFHRELLQPLTESIPRGYNAALLICGASTEEMSTLTDQSIIKEVEPETIYSFYVFLLLFLLNSSL